MYTRGLGTKRRLWYVVYSQKPWLFLLVIELLSILWFLPNRLKSGIVAYPLKNVHTHAFTRPHMHDVHTHAHLPYVPVSTVACKHTQSRANSHTFMQTHARKCTHTRVNSRTLAQNTYTREYLHIHWSKCTHTGTNTHMRMSTHAQDRIRPVISVKLSNFWNKERKLITEEYSEVELCLHVCNK